MRRSRVGGVFVALGLSAFVSTLCVGCGPTVNTGTKITWHGQEYVIDKPLPQGTPITCNLGNLDYGGSTYAVCTAPKRLVFHYSFIVIRNGYGSWVAVAVGEH